MDVSDRRMQVQLTQEARIASDFLYIRAILAVVGFVSALSAGSTSFRRCFAPRASAKRGRPRTRARAMAAPVFAVFETGAGRARARVGALRLYQSSYFLIICRRNLMPSRRNTSPEGASLRQTQVDMLSVMSEKPSMPMRPL